MKNLWFKLVWWIGINIFIIFLIALVLGYVGLWDMKQYIDLGIGMLSNSGGEGDGRLELKMEDIFLLQEQEMEKKKKNLELREEILKARELGLREVQTSYQGLKLQLKVKSDQLDAREEKMREIEEKKKDRGENLKDIANKIRNMRPDRAIERLEGLDLLLVIDIFRQMDQDASKEGRVSMVSFLLSEMSKETAQEIIRLKSRFPRED